MTLCSCQMVRHHIEPRQLRIFLETLFLIWSLLKMGTTFTRLEPFRLFSLGRLAITCVWRVMSTVCKLTWTWESYKTNMELDRRPYYKEGHVVVVKASSSSHKTGWEQFSTSLIERLLNQLITDETLCFFTFSHVALFCLVYWLKCEMSTWISVYV